MSGYRAGKSCYDSDDDLQVDSLAEGYASKEREFWRYHYGLLEAFDDHRKFLLKNFNQTLLEMTGNGLINWNVVDPERIKTSSGGYSKALSYVVSDVTELAKAQKITSDQMDHLKHLAKTVQKHRRHGRPTKDWGHRHASQQWTSIVEKLNEIIDL